MARRIIKKGAVYAAKDQLSVNSDTGLDLVLNLGGMAWEAMEKPDTRHIDLLPERIETIQMELPVGEHTVRIASERRGVGATSTEHAQVVNASIENGRNTIILCFRPSDERGDMVIVDSTR